MNRLSPLIARTSYSYSYMPAPVWEPANLPEPVQMLSDDLKLFATAWLGGLIFFGTLLV